MARAKDKEMLLFQANENYIALLSFINSMSDDEKNGVFEFEKKTSRTQAHWNRDKNVRDIIVHLFEWHQLLISWVTENLNGNQRPFIPAPYNWRTYGDLNVDFMLKHQTTELDEALLLFKGSHTEVMKMIDQFNNDQLFSKGVYDWVGGSTLGSYFISSTASHYDWALKKLNVYIKERNND